MLADLETLVIDQKSIIYYCGLRSGTIKCDALLITLFYFVDCPALIILYTREDFTAVLRTNSQLSTKVPDIERARERESDRESERESEREHSILPVFRMADAPTPETAVQKKPKKKIDKRSFKAEGKT